jgi:hypothetical protein
MKTPTVSNDLFSFFLLLSCELALLLVSFLSYRHVSSFGGGGCAQGTNTPPHTTVTHTSTSSLSSLPARPILAGIWEYIRGDKHRAAICTPCPFAAQLWADRGQTRVDLRIKDGRLFFTRADDSQASGHQQAFKAPVVTCMCHGTSTGLHSALLASLVRRRG